MQNAFYLRFQLIKFKVNLNLDLTNYLNLADHEGLVYWLLINIPHTDFVVNLNLDLANVLNLTDTRRGWFVDC